MSVYALFLRVEKESTNQLGTRCLLDESYTPLSSSKISSSSVLGFCPPDFVDQALFLNGGMPTNASWSAALRLIPIPSIPSDTDAVDADMDTDNDIDLLGVPGVRGVRGALLLLKAVAADGEDGVRSCGGVDFGRGEVGRGVLRETVEGETSSYHLFFALRAALTEIWWTMPFALLAPRTSDTGFKNGVPWVVADEDETPPPPPASSFESSESSSSSSSASVSTFFETEDTIDVASTSPSTSSSSELGESALWFAGFPASSAVVASCAILLGFDDDGGSSTRIGLYFC
jgi:hypothetical protein